MIKVDLIDLVMNALIELSRNGIRKINDIDINNYKDAVAKKLKEKKIDFIFDFGKYQYEKFLEETVIFVENIIILILHMDI